MKIAIQAADLDHRRIDGTRVYLLNVLKNLGRISPEDDFFIYHRKDFNPELTPPAFSNYKIKKANFPFLWTQTRFAWELFKDKPDYLWMPMHNIPIITKILKNKETKKPRITVTIHDLAFKYFPDNFAWKDLRELNLLTGLAIKRSDKIIAVSQSTKKDILKFYPDINPEKIKVIYHGFDSELFKKEFSDAEIERVLSSYKLKAKSYVLYVGAIQPRKNLEVLIEAFNLVKKDVPELKLALAGGKAWMWEDIFKIAENSKHGEDIIITGTIPFKDMVVLYKNAAVFVFPSLYEGFGIPVLEAFSAGIPVVCSKNSSLPEVAGDAAIYFESYNSEDLAGKIKNILLNKIYRQDLINKGHEQIKKFSWEKCARETLEWIKI